MLVGVDAHEAITLDVPCRPVMSGHSIRIAARPLIVCETFALTVPPVVSNKPVAAGGSWLRCVQ